MKAAFPIFLCLAMIGGNACAQTAMHETAQCAIDFGPARTCAVSDQVAADGTHHLRFDVDGKTVVFVGKSQTGWWSGTLDGKPAMGYELNRGHTVYSTGDLGQRFEWWTEGKQHGSY